jgi:hypothetical protein
MRAAYLFLMLICLQTGVTKAYAQTVASKHRPDSVQVLQAIQWLQEHSDYKILYRESDVHDLWIPFIRFEANLESIKDLKRSFERLANEQLLGLKWDDQRMQIILYGTKRIVEASQKQPIVHTTFQVVNDETGEILPFAQLAYRWNTDEEWNFIPSTPNGRFSLPLLAHDSLYERFIELEAHHIGFHTLAARIGIVADISGYTLRLTPEEIQASELIIWGDAQTLLTNQVYQTYVQKSSFGSLGETHTTRNLQQLASVGLNGAISEGVFVRGSDPTGFRVYLDQQQVYHDHHMFGLMDAMNSEALQTTGFYYSFIPARYSSPTGGLLDLTTRSGNRQHTNVSAKLSNSAYSFTAHGPSNNLKSSWLLSARRSLYSSIPQLSSINAIEYGLNINRPYSLRLDVPPNSSTNVRLAFDEPSVDNLSHHFMDLHGKWTMDIGERNVLRMSVYKGRDDSELNYTFPASEVADTPYDASYYWDANHAVINYLFEGNSSWIVESIMGFSSYKTRFLKEDYEYQVNELYSLGYTPGTMAPLSMNNEVQDFSLKQIWNTTRTNRSVELGWSYTDYQIDFSEQSLVIPSFVSNSSSQLVEVFAQSRQIHYSKLESTFGLRGQYYSNGQKIRWNPSLKLYLNVHAKFSLFFSLLEAHQFTHKLELYNQKSLDFWLLTQENQNPSKLRHWNLGLELNLSNELAYRTEAYLKQYADLRLHQLNAGLLSSLYSSASSTWLNESDGRGKGWEHYILWTPSDQKVSLQYTWANMILRTPTLLEGQEYDAPWDRKHQMHLGYELVLPHGLEISIQGMFGTGTPNIYGDADVGNRQRLPHYLRFDTNLSRTRTIHSYTIQTQLSIFNITNRQNVWYIDRVKAYVDHAMGSTEIFPQREVFDLGIYPSFSIHVKR